MPRSPYSGRFVVRLSDDIAAKIAERAQVQALADLESLQDLADSLDGLDALKQFFTRFPKHRTFRALAGIPNTEILSREKRAASRSSFPPPYSMTAYYIADTRPWKSPARSRRYLAELRGTSGIGHVYEESRLRAPNWAVAPTEPYASSQGYVNPAPEGVGANTVEVWGSYDGGGVGFVDVEAGWNLNHRDLPPAATQPQPIVHTNDDLVADHGTAVLGIVLGRVPRNQNREGITGIAPGAKFIGVSSWYLDPATVENREEEGSEDEETAGSEESDPYIARAITEAAMRLSRGDVLLVEVETAIGYPIEVEELTFLAITNASGNDIIVIEPAGNGTGTVSRDLDKPPTGRKGGPPKDRSLNRTAGSFKDSGAIFVSACRPTLTSNQEHRRHGYANHGSRVDCYAWGDGVATTGGYGLGPNKGKNANYTDDFHGTSAASAIIAGVALLVQEMAGKKPSGRLLPPAMSKLLSQWANGTPVLGPTKNTQIGVMPDLKKISTVL